MLETLKLHEMTGLVLTFNEEANIARCLEGLKRLPRVLVLDSFSTDRTLDICSRYSNVGVLQRKFDDFAAQWNYGLSLVKTPWVIGIDADYVLNEAFWSEIANAKIPKEIAGLTYQFRYAVFGRPLRSAMYPARILVHRIQNCQYEMAAHTQRLQVDGPLLTMKSIVIHDDRKPLQRWAFNQIRYSRENAVEALQSGSPRLQDRVRKWLVSPLLVVPYCLLFHGLILDGLPGVFYTLQRMFSEALTVLYVISFRLGGDDEAQDRSQVV